MGWGPNTRNLSAIGNIVRDCRRGFMVSVCDNTQNYLLANNIIEKSTDGAIVGMKWLDRQPGDYGVVGTKVPEHVTLSNNIIRI